MRELLFVGEDVDTLGRLASFYGTREPGWSVRQIATSDAARDYLGRRPVDVMCVCLGADVDQYHALMEGAAEMSPATVRLALSSAGTMPKAVPLAHQLIALREDLGELRPLLAGAIEVSRRARAHPRLAAIIGNLTDVPSPPTLYFDVREQLEDADGNRTTIAEVASRDPSLVARILKTVNSGFYGLPRSISDLSEAVALIGGDAVLGLVLAAHLYGGLPPPGLKLEVLWQHSLCVSALARKITQLEGGDRHAQSQSAVAGLLHDLGLLVLLENEPAQYQPLWQSCGGDEATLAQMERDTFGVTHGELGAIILMLWNLPMEVVEAVANSHAPAESFPGDEMLLSLTSRAVLASEWMLEAGGDTTRQSGVPRALTSVTDATMAQWLTVRDELAAEISVL